MGLGESHTACLKPTPRPDGHDRLTLHCVPVGNGVRAEVSMRDDYRQAALVVKVEVAQVGDLLLDL